MDPVMDPVMDPYMVLLSQQMRAITQPPATTIFQEATMKFEGKIAAIKAVREIGSQVRVQRNEETGRLELIPGIGLKEAKDLTEAIMALGVESYIIEIGGILSRYAKDQEMINSQAIRALIDMKTRAVGSQGMRTPIL